MSMLHDLLTEPLLSWRDGQRRRAKTTLPGLLEKLGSGELGDFPKVRTHQLHPWAMFLTQLAAIALRRAGKSDPRASEGEWREMLLALTEGAHEPWCLVVEDLSKPAFFQPPVPEAKSKSWSIRKEWDEFERPDELDILVLAKSHDVKAARQSRWNVESWVYALVTLQTTQGYPHPGYRQVARMNGGWGNRPRVGTAADHALCARHCRDTVVACETWESLLERGFSDRGIALVWTEPWDGKGSLSASRLSPHFIEICQRLRMLQMAESAVCLRTTSKVSRCIGAEEHKGDVGDPWIPVRREDSAALTVRKTGFDYELLSVLLFGGDYEPAPAQVPRAADGSSAVFLASALVRGKSKTDGLHERVLPLPERVRHRLFSSVQRAALGDRAAVHVQRAKDMRAKVLYPALVQLAQKGKVGPDRFEPRVDESFFESLFSTLEMEDSAAQLAWEERLVAIARDELERATVRHCLSDARRYRAVATAFYVFDKQLRTHFPDLVASERPETSKPQEEPSHE